MYAIVFPGQGAQSVGMAAGFVRDYAVAREAFAEADEALGMSLSGIIAEGPESRLRQTDITQPAILTVSTAIHRVLIAAGVPRPPALLAGHSLGEYSAHVAAGSLSLAAAVALVHRRGRYMQEAVQEGEGAMAAVIGLDGPEVARVCAATPGVVAPANFNAPEQTVIAGHTAAVEAASAALRAAGAKRIVPLDVSAPFHCSLMAAALDQMAKELLAASLRDAAIPIVSNVTAEPYTSADAARDLLTRQVCAPVQWVRCVERMRASGVKLVVEVGPGKVLSGLVARIDRGLLRHSVATVEDVAATAERIVAAGEAP
jgi:[acyl-carrier-protein] S-malonyltransferase